MTRTRTLLVLERLEDRQVLSVGPGAFYDAQTPSYGTTELGGEHEVIHLAWPDAGHLTLSFVPDGTLVGNAPSSLFRLLTTQGPSSAWQREILRAFQGWAENANINVGLTHDNGSPLGSLGAPQGDLRFGDIRIAARPLAPEVLATATGFDWSGTTWSGDVILNSDVLFGINGEGDYDLFTILQHEAGHVFGLDHSDELGSVMAETYAPGGGLSAGDVTAIQAMYGLRGPDKFDVLRPNETRAVASVLSTATTGFTHEADLTTRDDVDYYRFTTPHATGLSSFTIRARTSGISLLTSRLTVYDASGRVLRTTVAADPLSTDLSLQVTGIGSNRTYYVKVEDAGVEAFAVGGYQLRLNFAYRTGLKGLTASSGKSTSSMPNAFIDDGHTNDSAAAATGLPSQAGPTTNGRFDYYLKANFRDATDADWYRVQAPATADGQPQTMTVMAWAADASGLPFAVSVRDAALQTVAYQVLANDRGIFTLQVPAAVSGGVYFVQVAAARTPGSPITGNYGFGVDFDARSAVALPEHATHTLAAFAAQDFWSLEIARGQLFHFTFGADTAGQAAVGVRMTLYDAFGRVVYTRVATTTGQDVSGVIYLPRGDYTVRFSGRALGGSSLIPDTNYRVKGRIMNAAVGPEPLDTTFDTIGGPGGVLNPKEWTDALVSGYRWILTQVAPGFLSLGDPYSDPWW